MIRASIKKYELSGKVTAFAITVAAVVHTLISGTISSPYVLNASVSHPWEIHGCIRDVAPPITAEGYLYDRTTGAILYDAVTLRPIYA